MTGARWIVLGSRSPRRLELLRLVVPSDGIVVVPPRDSVEAGFAGLTTLAGIEARLVEVARTKCDDVRAQIDGGTAGIVPSDVAAVVTADTVIIATDSQGRPVVLGQPPDDDWRDTVRDWFHNHLLGRTHLAATAVCVQARDGRTRERVVSTEVTFHAAPPERVEWYLATGEPRGKAGGYAIQGAGSLFIARVEGSLSNVVGLPLGELLELLETSGVRTALQE